MLINSILVTLIIFFVFLTGSGLQIYEELSFVQFFQLSILFSGLIINLRYRKLLVKYFNNFAYTLKILMFSFLFYEEISFLTKGISSFLSSYNYQAEINFHNSNFMSNWIVLENFNMPILNYSFNLTFPVLLYSLILFFVGYGSYFPFLKKFRVLFFERKYSLYSFLYLFIIIIHSIQKNYLKLTSTFPLIHPELIELFLYILLLIDNINKISIIKSKIKNQ